MKTNRFTRLITAALALTALATTGNAEKANSTDNAAPPSKVVAPTNPDVASAEWLTIKDHTFDTRAQFFAGLKQLEAKVDSQMSELTTRRAAMPSTANTKDWDFAMKEMVNARAYLKSTGEELTKATPETWDQQKDKVGLAWVRSQEAYTKVKTSTTS